MLIMILVILDKFHELVFELIGRCRRAEERSSAASVIGKECQMMVSDNPNRSKASSVSIQGINKVKEIADFIFSKRY